MRTAVLSLFCLLFMIFHAGLVTKGAAAGLLLWYSAVVPALFPFMVLSSVLSASGAVQALMRPFAVIFRFLGVSPDGWYVFLTGLLCGCPMGAKTCADLLAEERLCPGEAKFLFVLCNHPSPMFLAGFVYPSFAAYIPLSYFVYAIYVPLAVLAVPAHLIYMRGGEKTAFVSAHPASGSHPLSKGKKPLSLDRAILNSAELLIKIGGYLIFYSILILVIQNTAVIPASVRLFFSGVLEITTGINAVQADLAFPASAIASAAIFSFGGLSAMSQTGAVIRMHDAQPETDRGHIERAAYSTLTDSRRHKKTAGLSIRQYLLWKLAHSVLTAITMAGLLV